MKILVTLSFLLSFSISSHARETGVDNGIYLTREDFEKDILSYASQSNGDILEEKRLGDIKIIRNGETLQFSFGKFYGYKNKGQKYMSFGTRAFLHHYGYYKMIDDSGLLIYIQRTPHPLHLYVEAPYFSTQSDSKKYPLTLHHIKKQTPVNRNQVNELRWFGQNTGSLATMVNGKSIVNILLTTTK